MEKLTAMIMGKMTVTRQCTLIIVLALCVLLAISYPSSASSITLKQDSIVSDSTIKLGDIFHGLPHSADKVLGPSPRPGQNMVLNARTLMRIAIAMDLPWKPVSTAEYVTLRRSATLIDRETIEMQIKDKLNAEGLSGSYNLSIPVERSEIILPASEPATMEITDIKIQRKNNWFEARVVAPSKDNPIHQSNISGTYERLVAIPVLVEPLRAGTIIGQRDIQMIEMPERYLNQDTIVKAENLIGTTPRRMIAPGQAIKATEIQEPTIVERGEYVTVNFSKGPLQLTAKAKALQNGARGDIIRVVNMSSNKTIDAIVTASKEVTVQTF